MKKIIYILFAVLLITSCGGKIPANAKTDTFHVSGNCGMCKKTIEKSLKVDGVFDADWDKKTKMITVKYDPATITLDGIKNKIANAGYDNDGYKADSSAYENLHSCCKYERNPNK